jgi:DNA-binding transcriptional ArsR family regulator
MENEKFIGYLKEIKFEAQKEIIDDLVKFVEDLKSKYGLQKNTNINPYEDIIASAMVSSEVSVSNKNDEILSLLKNKGQLTSDQICNALIEKKIFDDTDGARNNIRSRLSRLATAGLIKQESRGGNYEFVKNT